MMPMDAVAQATATPVAPKLSAKAQRFLDRIVNSPIPIRRGLVHHSIARVLLDRGLCFELSYIPEGQEHKRSFLATLRSKEYFDLWMTVHTAISNLDRHRDWYIQLGESHHSDIFQAAKCLLDALFTWFERWPSLQNLQTLLPPLQLSDSYQWTRAESVAFSNLLLNLRPAHDWLFFPGELDSGVVELYRDSIGYLNQWAFSAGFIREVPATPVPEPAPAPEPAPVRDMTDIQTDADLLQNTWNRTAPGTTPQQAMECIETGLRLNAIESVDTPDEAWANAFADTINETWECILGTPSDTAGPLPETAPAPEPAPSPASAPAPAPEMPAWQLRAREYFHSKEQAASAPVTPSTLPPVVITLKLADTAPPSAPLPTSPHELVRNAWRVYLGQMPTAPIFTALPSGARAAGLPYKMEASIKEAVRLLTSILSFFTLRLAEEEMWDRTTAADIHRFLITPYSDLLRKLRIPPVSWPDVTDVFTAYPDGLSELPRMVQVLIHLQTRLVTLGRRIAVLRDGQPSLDQWIDLLDSHAIVWQHICDWLQHTSPDKPAVSDWHYNCRSLVNESLLNDIKGELDHDNFARFISLLQSYMLPADSDETSELHQLVLIDTELEPLLRRLEGEFYVALSSDPDAASAQAYDDDPTPAGIAEGDRIRDRYFAMEENATIVCKALKRCEERREKLFGLLKQEFKGGSHA